MTDRKLVQSLLKQDATQTERCQDLERRIAMAVERKRRQVARMRIVVAIGWLTFVLIILAGVIAAAAGYQILWAKLGIVSHAALLLAIFFTISWYVRNISLRFDIVQQALAAIQERLELRSSE
ncbi:MAG: hypothetical protein HQ546_07480 [Planctomycetes bacterium]|nr:hypothetical protein [Planctomycetota bacterium]